MPPATAFGSASTSTKPTRKPAWPPPGPQEERARLAALAPYLVSSPRREVVGSSRYAVRLRKDLAAAAKDPKR